MSVLVAKPAVSLMSVVKSALSGIGAVLASVAAAGAVSNAIENRRQPAAADLAVLGLEGVKFNLDY